MLLQKIQLKDAFQQSLQRRYMKNGTFFVAPAGVEEQQAG